MQHLWSAGSSLNGFVKRHKRKIFFFSTAVAVGYAGYRLYSAVGEEIEGVKRQFGQFAGAAGNGGSGALSELSAAERRRAKREQLFLHSQLLCDRILLSLGTPLEQNVERNCPALTAEQLKERLDSTPTKQGKVELMQGKVRQVLEKTALGLYSLTLLVYTLKLEFAVIGTFMYEQSERDEDEQQQETEQEEVPMNERAEKIVSRTTARFFEEGNGMDELRQRIGDAVEEALEGWKIQTKCSAEKYAELWAAVRRSVEDTNKSNLTAYIFPSSRNLERVDVLEGRIEKLMREAEARATLSRLLDMVHSLYVQHAQAKLETAGKALPLLRAIAQVQALSDELVRGMDNPYLQSILTSVELLEFLRLHGVGDVTAKEEEEQE